MSKVGLHFDIAEDVYHSWDGASASRLSQLRQSPAHCKLSMSGGRTPTKAMILGSAIHAAILTPVGYKTQYGIIPANLDGRSKEGKESKAALQLQFGDRVLDADTVAEVIDPVVASIKNHPAASQLLSQATQLESSAYWIGDAGVPRKARIDGYCQGLGIAFDIKTTTDAKASEFARSIYTYGYHLQAAHYLSALKHFDVDVHHFVFIVVEKTMPFGVGVYRLTNEAIVAGQVQLERLLKKFDECTLSNCWPCYSDKIQDIGLPQWAINQINEEALNE